MWRRPFCITCIIHFRVRNRDLWSPNLWCVTIYSKLLAGSQYLSGLLQEASLPALDVSFPVMIILHVMALVTFTYIEMPAIFISGLITSYFQVCAIFVFLSFWSSLTIIFPFYVFPFCFSELHWNESLWHQLPSASYRWSAVWYWQFWSHVQSPSDSSESFFAVHWESGTLSCTGHHEDNVTQAFCIEIWTERIFSSEKYRCSAMWSWNGASLVNSPNLHDIDT